MDIGRAIQYWLSDPDWIKKVLIGGLIAIIPIVGWLIVGGYYIRVIQRVSSGTDTPLPEWGDWGGDLVRGLKFVGVVLIWMIPVFALSFCVAALGFVDDAAGSAAGLLLNCLVFIYSIAFYFVYPVLIGRFAVNEDFSQAFQISDIIQDVQKIPSQLLIFVIMWFVIGFVASFGLILCIIGVVFTGFIGYLISGHLVAQISNMLGYTSPPPPPQQQQYQQPDPPPAI